MYKAYLKQTGNHTTIAIPIVIRLLKKVVFLAQAGTTKCSAKLILMQPKNPTRALRFPIKLGMTM